jgi:O6-methylguanine-DNA--protein-cysteine methyltransferase
MPNASRAIGQANGRNPIPIIIPCHRVIQHDGTLGGYTGGLKIKSFLLGLERPRQLQLAVNGTLLNPQDRALTLL